MIGICIRRMDFCVPIGEFVMSQRAREVQAFRDDETAPLAARTPSRPSPAPGSRTTAPRLARRGRQHHLLHHSNTIETSTT
ncbi:hypothetical protein BX286_0191 [Streptomyces sp. 3211.6]|nr:hypothetical protein BX286_0191 [Streptomyces sp. 3211.6]